MKTQRQYIINDLLTALNTISQMQKQGMLQLQQKISYGLGRNYAEAMKVKKEFEQFQKDMLLIHVEKNGNKFETIEVVQGGQKFMKWKYYSAESKAMFEQAMDDFIEAEVDFNSFKISQDDLKTVHNIPIDILATLDEFDITTELSLASPLKLMN